MRMWREMLVVEMRQCVGEPIPHSRAHTYARECEAHKLDGAHEEHVTQRAAQPASWKSELGNPNVSDPVSYSKRLTLR